MADLPCTIRFNNPSGRVLPSYKPQQIAIPQGKRLGKRHLEQVTHPRIPQNCPKYLEIPAETEL